jgi:phage-related tail fiber protein
VFLAIWHNHFFAIFAAMNLSHLITALALVVPLAAAAQNSQDFKKRFQAADVDKDGKLTRAEAYAAFPLIPQYFDEIDMNRDGSITMVEVDAAMNKRVDAALAASKTASGRYALPPETSGLSGPATATTSSVLVDHDEARVFHGRQYYDSLAGDLAQDQMRGEPVPRNPAPDQFRTSF